jgi:hypothetical protein
MDGNKRLSETISYEFSKELILVRGESFSSTFSWEKIPKIVINRYWILIFQSKTTANIIRRTCFNDTDLATFIEIVTSYPEIKKKIKT